MKFAINIINFGDCGDALTLAELARTAEEVGWDGFFVWDHIAWDGRITVSYTHLTLPRILLV